MNSKVFLFAVVAVISCASATVVQKCPNGPDPISVAVKGCDKEPCLLPSGQNAIMDVTFKSSKYTATLKPKVRATVAGVTVDYTLPAAQQDGCKALQGSFCPVDKDETVTYRLVMPIEGFPLVSVNVEFSVLGDGNTVLQCFKVSCKVTAAGTLIEVN